MTIPEINLTNEQVLEAATKMTEHFAKVDPATKIDMERGCMCVAGFLGRDEVDGLKYNKGLQVIVEIFGVNKFRGYYKHGMEGNAELLERLSVYLARMHGVGHWIDEEMDPYEALECDVYELHGQNLRWYFQDERIGQSDEDIREADHLCTARDMVIFWNRAREMLTSRINQGRLNLA